MAQLPILRKAVTSSTTAPTEGGSAGTGNEEVVWEGYHVGCI